MKVPGRSELFFSVGNRFFPGRIVFFQELFLWFGEVEDASCMLRLIKMLLHGSAAVIQ